MMSASRRWPNSASPRTRSRCSRKSRSKIRRRSATPARSTRRATRRSTATPSPAAASEPMAGTIRGISFDFNGTLSDDEPILYSIYRDLFAEHGRPLGEQDYYGQLAGLSEEAIISGWLDVDGEELASLVAERV